MSDAKSALVQVLTLATSSDPAQLAQANSQLQGWEKDHQFWIALLEIAFDQNLQIPSAAPTATNQQQQQQQQRDAIRTIAIIRFKNVINKYWRSHTSPDKVAIFKQSKNQIRSALFQCLQEPNRAIALQASVAISKIARYDYPTEWPELFNVLQRAMVEAHGVLASLGPAPSGGATVEGANAHTRLLNTTILMRSADVCAKAFKELESVRLLSGKIRMTKLSKELLPVLHPIFQQYFAEIFSLSAASDLPSLAAWASSDLRSEQVRTSHLLLKAISRLAVADIGMISRTSTAEGGTSINLAQAFFRSTPQSLQTLKDTRLAYLRLLRSPKTALSMDAKQRTLLLPALTKHLYSFGKFFLALLQNDKGKAAFWDGWSEVVAWYWIQAKDVSSESLSVPRDEYANHAALIDYPARFVVQALVLLKRSLHEWKGKPEAGVFGTEVFATECADVLAGKLMRLNSDDLERWQADPEEWIVGEEQENYELDIRPAAERALMVLAQHTRPIGIVGEHIWKHFQASVSLSADNLDDILTRDAIYTAVGRCRDYLCRVGEDDDIPSANQLMGKVIAERLVPEARLHRVNSPLWVVIRRRILWLLCEWSQQVLVESRKDVYALLVDLLQDIPGQTDVAVRLAAARCVSALVDAFDFDADEFEPFLSTALSRLATLAAASDLHEMDSIQTCTHSLSVVIERMGPRVAPHADALVSLVPMLWQQQDPDCKVKPSVIVFLSKLLRAVEMLPLQGPNGALIERLHSVVAPIVRESLNPTVSHLLAKDALSLLWIRALDSTPNMTQPLFQMLELVKDLVAQPDYCVETCKAIEKVSMLSPLEMLQTYGNEILTSFSSIIADPSSPKILAPVSALDVLVQSLAQLPNWNDIRENWIQMVDSTGIVAALIGSLLHTMDSPATVEQLIGLLCRIAYNCTGSSFIQLVRSCCRHMSQTYPTSTDIWPSLLTTICQRFEYIASDRRRGATALGLVTILESAVIQQGLQPGNQDTQQIFSKLPEMIAVWSEMVAEIKERPLTDRTKFTRPAPGGFEEDISPGSTRSQNIMNADPTLSRSVIYSIAQVLQRGSQLDLFTQVTDSMDPLVLDVFQKDLSS